MTFKKRGPGCPCECGETPCNERCLFRCNGEAPCPSACAIRIDMPTPDSVSEASGPSCPPADCDLDGLCNVCKVLFDGIFYLEPTTFRSYTSKFIQCMGDVYGGEDYAAGTYEIETTTGSGCTSNSILYANAQNILGTVFNCWQVHNVNCPECNTYSYLQCGSMYGIKDPYVKIDIVFADGCSTTTVTIEYTVHQYCDEQIILPSTVAASPETTYTHVFERTNQCDCEDVLGALTFVSTTSVNNERGITVPDVCNAASASVSLVDTNSCGCICFDCFDFSEDINVSFTGADFTGTIVCKQKNRTILSYDQKTRIVNTPCIYEGSVYADCGRIFVKVTIDCLPCEKYSLRVDVFTGSGPLLDVTPIVGGLFDAVIIDCSQLTHTFSYSGDCDLGTTLTLS